MDFTTIPRQLIYRERRTLEEFNIHQENSLNATLDSLKSKVDRLQANSEEISQECDALKQAILRKVFE